MRVLELLSAAGVICSLAYYVAASLAARSFARRARAQAPALPKLPPRVAILKPLHGLTQSLVENVISYLELSYPRLDYFFSVEGYDDAAAQVPAALRARYQFANLTLVVGEEPDCANRKIAKVIRMAERADKAEVFVLSDADVSVERDHLIRVIGELIADEKIGIVTCAYRARPLGPLGSRLEALFVNTDFAPQVMLSAAIEPMRHALGATIAVRRATLDAIGGFRALKDLLADDFYLGRMAAERGWKVRLSDSLVTVACEERSVAEFWNHQLRWARTYRTVRPVSLATIAIHGPSWALMLIISSAISPLSLVVLGIVLAARCAMAAFLLVRVLKLPEFVRDVWLVPIKDLLMTGIWFASLAGNSVMWAGRRYRIMRGGAMRELAG
ncbi:MAG TPA: bacteriohopanetetrol glucosamine biosynthesis glycosyltransferase HpnI [Candidatus Binataceae bacterium]|nr:bacteriohopanetetrol glucosamine biosynthesis glycosyltransferase HpnI [Candidatus Binataceae bacterium]